METRLTLREKEVLIEIIKGESNPQIAKKLNISVETAHTHVKSILRKLKAKNRVVAAVKGLYLLEI